MSPGSSSPTRTRLGKACITPSVANMSLKQRNPLWLFCLALRGNAVSRKFIHMAHMPAKLLRTTAYHAGALCVQRKVTRKNSLLLARERQTRASSVPFRSTLLAYIRSLALLPLPLYPSLSQGLRVFIRHESPESTGTVVSSSSQVSVVIRAPPHLLGTSQQCLAVRLDTAKSPVIDFDSSTPALPCLGAHRPLLPSDWLARGQKRGRLARSLFSRPKFIAWLPALSCRRPVISSSSRTSAHPVHTGIDSTKAF